MKNLIFMIVAGIILLVSCAKEESKEVTYTKVNGKKVPLLHFEDVKDSISLSLSDVVSGVEFVKLETREDALISQAEWIVGKKYLIAFCYDQGLFQFDRDGKFVRKLAFIGRGPKEIQYPVFNISEKNDLLFLVERNSPVYILSIDLETGSFLNNILLTRPGRIQNIILTKDTILACAPLVDSGLPSGKYYFFRQTTSGIFIDGILTGNKEGESYDNGENLLYKVGESLHYRPVNSDTVFLIKKNHLEPFFIFDAGNNALGPDVQIGRTTFSIVAETPGYFILKIFTITTKEQMGEKAFRYKGKQQLLLIDKKNERAHYISSFYNDFTGEKLNPYYAKFQSNGIFYMAIDAYSLLEKIEKVKSDPNLEIKNRDDFLKLSEGLTENDNPVLLIGKIKTLHIRK
jgi:hypothetical protein